MTFLQKREKVFAMNESKIVGPNKKRKLLECEQRMLGAARDAILGTASVGIELKRIHQEDLFLATHGTWSDYVEQRWEMAPKRAFELISLGERIPDIVAKAKELGLPAPNNEYQMRDLLKLPAHIAADVWVKAANKAKEDKVPLSHAYIEPFAKDVTPQEPVKSHVIPLQKKGESLVAASESSSRVDKVGEVIARKSDDRLNRFSSQAEKTLERIFNLFGKAPYEAILDGVLKISDRELVNWGTHTGNSFESLGRYIIEQRWTFGKAHKFLFQDVSGDTKAETLINLAISRGGEKTTYIINEWEFILNPPVE